MQDFPPTAFLNHITPGLPIPFATFFFASTVLHTYQTIIHRSFPFTWPLPFASLFVFTSLLILSITTLLPDPQSATIAQGSAIQGLLYTSFPLYTLSLFLLIRHPSLSIPKAWIPYLIAQIITWTVISINAQGSAAYFDEDASDDRVVAGLRLLKANFVLQLFLNVVGVGVFGSLLWREEKRRNGPERTSSVYTLAMTSLVLVLLLLVRNVFATTRIFSSPENRIWTSEGYFWLCEVGAMVVWNVVVHVWHPGGYVKGGVAGRCREVEPEQAPETGRERAESNEDS